MLELETNITKGAPESIKKMVDSIPQNYDLIVEGISAAGETPITIARNGKAIGIIRLKDVLKQGIKEKIQALKTMGIRPVMITGDQPSTANNIASEVESEDTLLKLNLRTSSALLKKQA